MNQAEWGRYKDKCDTCFAPPTEPCIDRRRKKRKIILQVAHVGRVRYNLVSKSTLLKKKGRH